MAADAPPSILADEVEAIETRGMSGAVGRATQQAHGNPLRTIWSVSKVVVAFVIYLWLTTKTELSRSTHATPDDLALTVMEDMEETQSGGSASIDGPPAPAHVDASAPADTAQTTLGSGLSPSQAAPTTPAVDKSPAPVDVLVFLERMHNKVQRAKGQTEQERRANDRRESVLFRALLGMALVTAAIAIAALLLIFTGRATVGVVSGGLALLTGVGTLNLRRLWAAVKGRDTELRTREHEHDALLEAIEFTLAIPDPEERQRQTAELATHLQKRAFEARAARVERTGE